MRIASYTYMTSGPKNNVLQFNLPVHIVNYNTLANKQNNNTPAIRFSTLNSEQIFPRNPHAQRRTTRYSRLQLPRVSVSTKKVVGRSLILMHSMRKSPRVCAKRKIEKLRAEEVYREYIQKRSTRRCSVSSRREE